MASISSLVIPRTNSNNSLFTLNLSALAPASASLLILLSVAVFLPACVTRNHAQARIDPKSRPVYISASAGGSNRARLDDILSRQGYHISTNRVGSMVCELSLVGPRTPSVEARVTLYSESGATLLWSSSKNYGWGTLLAPSAATQDVIQSAIEEFSKALYTATIR